MFGYSALRLPTSVFPWWWSSNRPSSLSALAHWFLFCTCMYCCFVTGTAAGLKSLHKKRMWKLTVEYRGNTTQNVSQRPLALYFSLRPFCTSRFFYSVPRQLPSPLSPLSYPSLCLSCCLEAVTCLRRLNRTPRPYLTATCCTCVCTCISVCVKRRSLAWCTMKHVRTLTKD